MTSVYAKDGKNASVLKVCTGEKKKLTLTMVMSLIFNEERLGSEDAFRFEVKRKQKFRSKPKKAI